MSSSLKVLERLARISGTIGIAREDTGSTSHPFEERNIHPEISAVSIKLFDDGHYSQATFEAFKFIEVRVKAMSGLQDTGFSLMMTALSETKPRIKLTALQTLSEKDEQLGYRHIFAGAVSAIRNPRGHEINFDPIGRCLDHLSFASVLLRRLEETVS